MTKDTNTEIYTLTKVEFQNFAALLTDSAILVDLRQLVAKCEKEISEKNAESRLTLERIFAKIKKSGKIPDLDIAEEIADVKDTLNFEDRKSLYLGERNSETPDKLKPSSGSLNIPGYKKPSVSKVMSLARMSKRELKEFWIEQERAALGLAKK